jgi:hypothetical protein
MKKVDQEFAFQSRELGAQIADTLGDPPNRKHYQMVVNALLGEYANGSGLDDVNLLSFALLDQLKFNDPAGLLKESANYEDGDAEAVRGMVSVEDDIALLALESMAASHPELTRQALITAFLHKNHKRWKDEDRSLETLQKQEDGDDDTDDKLDVSDEVEHLFDATGDDHAE